MTTVDATAPPVKAITTGCVLVRFSMKFFAVEETRTLTRTEVHNPTNPAKVEQAAPMRKVNAVIKAV